MSVKNAMTAEFLRSAYGGESMAHMRYLGWADKADREGFPKTARLLRAVAYAEQVHANNHFVVLGGDVGDSAVTAGAVFPLVAPSYAGFTLRGKRRSGARCDYLHAPYVFAEGLYVRDDAPNAYNRSS